MLSLDEAIERANAALADGADLAFVEATQTLEEVAAVPKRVKGPCLLNVVPGGHTPDLDLATAEAWATPRDPARPDARRRHPGLRRGRWPN